MSTMKRRLIDNKWREKFNSLKVVKYISTKYMSWENADEPRKIDWLAFGIVAAFMMMMVVNLGDCTITLKQSVAFDEALFSGNFFRFYEYCAENSAYCQQVPIWEVTPYIVLGVFTFPAFLLKSIFQINIFASFSGLVYAKILESFFVACSAYLMYKLCKNISNNKTQAKWAVLLFVSSYQVLLQAFGMGQWDIIPIFFMLKMLDSFSNENHSKFLLWSAMAITVKSFALFIFIPLLLLREKSVIKILGNSLLGISGLIVCKLMFIGDPMYQSGRDYFLKAMMGNLISSHNVSLSLGQASTFCMAMVAISVFAYSQNYMEFDKTHKLNWIFFIPVYVFSALFLFMSFHSNWSILISPFLVLLVILNTQRIKMNLLLDIAINISLGFMLAYGYKAMYSTDQFKHMLMDKTGHLAVETQYKTFYDVFSAGEAGMLMHILTAVFVTCLVAFLCVNRPKNRESVNFTMKNNKGLVLLRTVSIMSLMLPLLILGLISKIDAITILNTNYTQQVPNEKLVDTSIFKQEFALQREANITELKIPMTQSTEMFPLLDAGVIYIKLVDVSKNQVIFENSYASSSVRSNPNERWIVCEFDKIKLESNKKYSIILEQDHTVDQTWSPFVIGTPKGAKVIKPLVINGKETPQVMCFELYGETNITEPKDLNGEIIDKALTYNEKGEGIVTVKVKNKGVDDWSEFYKIHLGCLINDVDMNNIRGYILPGEFVKSNEEVTFELNLGAISKNDKITLQMVEEGKRWFGDKTEFTLSDLE